MLVKNSCGVFNEQDVLIIDDKKDGDRKSLLMSCAAIFKGIVMLPKNLTSRLWTQNILQRIKKEFVRYEEKLHQFIQLPSIS